MFATTQAGTVVWTASWLPFGGVHVTTGAPIEARFPGQWFEAESGLHQNWMRDYDPTTGRYIEPDPLGLVDGASIYGYARQNPGRWTDPRGEYAQAVCAVPGLCPAIGRFVAQVCIEGAKLAVGAAAGLFATTEEACGCEDDCDYPKGIMWKPGGKKSQEKLERQMAQRGWTHDMISEAVYCGECVSAPNLPNPGNGARRCTHPRTGQFVVIDSATNGVIQVAGPGFLPND